MRQVSDRIAPIFLEPEGLDTNEIYVMDATRMPIDVQAAVLASYRVWKHAG